MCRRPQTAPSSRESGARPGAPLHGTENLQTPRGQCQQRPSSQRPSARLTHVAKPGLVLCAHDHLVRSEPAGRVELAIRLLVAEPTGNIDPVAEIAAQPLLR